MESLLEADIEQDAADWAVARGWMSFKFTPQGQTGFPDRLFISLCGIHVWIEFKKPGEEPRKLQRYRLKKLREQAVNAHWVDTLAQAQTLLKFYEV